MPAVRHAALALLCLLAAGCGNERAQPPDLATPGPRLGDLPVRLPTAGVAFTAPAGWRVETQGPAPLLARVRAGRASVAVFRYPRTEPLPRTAKQLDAAVEALAGAARQRDPTFAEVRRSRARVDGRPAVVLRGTGTVAGQPRALRSTHVYAFGAELVVDAMAPDADFKRVDAEAFRAIVRSLRLSDPAT